MIIGSSATELFSKHLTPVEPKRWLCSSNQKYFDTKQSSSLPCNLKVILQTIIVNFPSRALSSVSVYDPSAGPEGEGKGGRLNLLYVG